MAFLLLVMLTTALAASLWEPVRDLLRRPVVLDTLRGRITRGESLLCDLTDVRGVERHHSFVATAQREFLGLVTRSGPQVCLITGFGYCRDEIPQVGRQVAAFPRVEFVDDDPVGPPVSE